MTAFTNFVPLKIEMNTLPSRHKQCHFNLSTSPPYLVKLKIAQNGRPLTAVRYVEPIVRNFRRKSFSVPFVCSLFVIKLFSSLLTKIFYIRTGFYQKFIFKLNMVNFSM